MKKLMIASPCHGGKVNNTFTLSLIQSLYLLDHAGIQTIVLLPTTGSILAKERNQIVHTFMKSDCTHLLCIDSDMGWDPAAPMKFLQYDTDIIAGVYPVRNNKTEKRFIFKPDTNPDNSIITDGKLLKMLAVPAGFLMISKVALLRMQESLQHLKYYGYDVDMNVEEGYAFFNTEIIDGDFWGEDYVFCNNAKKAGLDIWCDPTIQFTHDNKTGALTEILTGIKPINNNTYEFKTSD
jgi:hypothetical protein